MAPGALIAETVSDDIFRISGLGLTFLQNSAYSVFNKGIMRLKGTFTTDQLELLYTGQSFEDRQGAQPREIGFLPSNRHISRDGLERIHHLASVPRLGSNRRIGRNERCFCGSGKKYKFCCEKLSFATISDSSESESD